MAEWAMPTIIRIVVGADSHCMPPSRCPMSKYICGTLKRKLPIRMVNQFIHVFLFTSPLVTPPAVWRLGFVCFGTRDIAMQQQRMAEVAVQTGPTLDPLPSKN